MTKIAEAHKSQIRKLQDWSVCSRTHLDHLLDGELFSPSHLNVWTLDSSDLAKNERRNPPSSQPGENDPKATSVGLLDAFNSLSSWLALICEVRRLFVLGCRFLVGRVEHDCRWRVESGGCIVCHCSTAKVGFVIVFIRVRGSHSHVCAVADQW